MKFQYAVFFVFLPDFDCETMDDFFDDKDEGTDIDELVSHFEQMLKGKGFFFFDTEEFEDLIDYYFMRNNLKKARLVLQYALEQYPFDIRIRIKSAHLHLRNNRIEQAFEVLRKAEEDAPDNSDVFIAKAMAYSTLRNHRKAIEEYEKALKNTDDYYPVYLNMSHEYEMLEDYDNAIEYIVKILYLDPENIGALYELSYLITTSLNFEKGVVILNDFLDEYPYSSVAWTNLGLVYFNLELFEKAIDSLDFAIAIDPDYGEAYYHKAISLMSLENYQEALELLLASPAYNLEPEAITLALAECYEKTGDIKNAIEQYNELTETESFKQAAYIGLSVCYEHLNKTEAALMYARKANEIKSENPEALFTLASLLQRLGNNEEAIEVFKEINNEFNSDPEFFQEYAIAYASIFQYGEAIDILDNAMVFHPKNPEIMFQRTAYLFLNGRRKEAFDSLYICYLYYSFSMEALFDYAPTLKTDNEIISYLNQLKD